MREGGEEGKGEESREGGGGTEGRERDREGERGRMEGGRGEIEGGEQLGGD